MNIFFTLFYLIFNKYYSIENFGINESIKLFYILSKFGLLNSDYKFLIINDKLECDELVHDIRILQYKSNLIDADILSDYDKRKLSKIKNKFKMYNYDLDILFHYFNSHR